MSLAIKPALILAGVITRDWNATPPKPTWIFEGRYENGFNLDLQPRRRPAGDAPPAGNNDPQERRGGKRKTQP